MKPLPAALRPEPAGFLGIHAGHLGSASESLLRPGGAGTGGGTSGAWAPGSLRVWPPAALPAGSAGAGASLGTGLWLSP